MDDESFIGAFGDVPTDLAGDYSQLYIFRAEDFGAWYRRVRNAHEREVDDAVADALTDAQLADHGLVRLPVSEDGDVLHIGELVDEKLPFGGYAAPAPIDTMELSRGAGGYRWMVKLDAENRALISSKLLRHHHEPTVEDVLFEFADEMNQNLGMYTGEVIDADEWRDADARTVEKYAERLELREVGA